MKLSLKLVMITIFFIALFMMLPFFSKTLFQDSRSVSRLGKMRMVTTTNIIADALKAIGGDKLEVTALMGPGVDPHLYQARESDVRTLADADIIFYNGLHLEGKMADLLAGMQNNIKTVALGETLPSQDLLKTNFEGMYDPHIWHDVNHWIKVVENIKEILCAYDNKCDDFYEKNTQKYVDQLKRLDQEIKKKIEVIPKRNRILVTAHDAFSYFGKAYGFTVLALQGISTDSEISTRDIQYLVRYIVKNKIPAIFVESSIPYRSVHAVQKAVEANGWQVVIGPELYSDSLGALDSQAGTYIDMIKHNINAIVSVLRLPEQINE